MNTIKSVYYGWGTLIVAGGGAYYFAKKSINADRAAKAEADHQKRLAQYQLEATLLHNQPSTSTSSSKPPTPKHNARSSSSDSKTPVSDELKKRGEQQHWSQAGNDAAGNPSEEASVDPAPTRHEPENEGQKVTEKSKYEASDVYRQKRGDRFS